MANTTALTPSSRSAVTASSRARTRLTGLTAANFTSLLLAGRNEPFVGEREELVRVDLHAPQLSVVGAVVGERPEESVRLPLGEDRVQLAVDRAALLVVERELALDDQPVHFGVGVAAEVVLPGADLGRVEQRRDVGRVVEHPGREHDVEVVLEEHVLLPGLPLLELDLDRGADALEVVLEREHDALHRLALLLDRDLERQRQPLAAFSMMPASASSARARSGLNGSGLTSRLYAQLPGANGPEMTVPWPLKNESSISWRLTAIAIASRTRRSASSGLRTL